MDKEHYKNDYRLNARKYLHEHFHVQEMSWNTWLYYQLSLEDVSDVLEVGCGNGQLWKEVLSTVPQNKRITLTDYSEGMIDRAKRSINHDAFRFLQADVMKLPFANGSYDLVLASHMLYHVTDLDQALREIHRVLKPGGVFIASAFGVDNFQELIAFVDEQIPEIHYKEKQEKITTTFNLDNNVKDISKYFDRLDRIDYEDQLMVTESVPLAEYILSLTDSECINPHFIMKVHEIVERLIVDHNPFVIQKSVGVIRGQKKLLR